MSVIGGQNPVVQDGLVYILDFGNVRSYTSGSNSAKSLIYNPVTASFVAPPAGDYSGLAAAYSVRRVVSGYTGSAMEVQSGSVSASIGFDANGNLDTGSLLTFAGSGNAFVKTWYDQSGNGRHASQAVTSSQPIIVESGVVHKDNNISAIKTTETQFMVTSVPNPLAAKPYTILGVYKILNTSGTRYFIGSNSNLHVGWRTPNVATTVAHFGNDINYPLGTLPYPLNSMTLHTPVFTKPGSKYFINSNLIGSSSTTPSGAGLDSGNLMLFTGYATVVEGGMYSGSTHEIIVYDKLFPDTELSSIHQNINSYYNIYTSSFSPTPGFDTNKIDLSRTVAVDTNRTFPGFSYNQGNLTLIFTGETKTNTPLFTQANQMSVVGTTSSISYGLPNNTIGRTFPASGFDHISLRFTTGSVDCFVNGIPTGPNSIFPTGSFGTGDFIASNYSGSLGNLMVYNRPLSDDEIYSIYLQQARRYSLPETPKPYTVDSSVYVYSQAAGITDTVTLNALNTFVQGLKSASLWDKMVAIYPFIGVNSSGSRLNLKDVSLNTTQVNYSGSWSTSLSGSRNNNTSSFGTLSNITPSYVYPLINTQSFHMAYLSYDTPANSGSLMGATNQVIASGGQVFDISGSRFHVFTASANLTVTQGGPVQAFVVAGGGGGGNHGGGGAGGVRYLPVNVPQGTTSVTVGLGGTAGLNGQNSTFSTITSAGGGGGGSFSSTGSSGGSGGGGGTNSGSGNIPTTNPAQGFDGGLSLDAFTGAGGGGASEKAPNPTIHRTGGRGGSGSFFSQFVSTGYGSPAGWFGGGGGGGAYNVAGLGGIGGGGDGNINGPGVGRTGSVNTGGGGGAGYYNIGGSGGSGIIIVSYPINTGSVLLNATPSDISGSINNTDVNGFFAGGPLGLVMTSRTGLRAYSVSKNKVIFNYTSSASSSISNNILLNAVNVNGTASFPIQNNVAYASVGAGLTNDETRTYYDLVDTFQTSLGRKNFDTGSFITLWDTRLTGSGTSNSSSIVLPLYGTQAITASWGDGTTSNISSSAQADRTHVYATPGRYLVSITGSGQGFRFNGTGDRNKLLDIGQWGSISGSVSTVFYGCTNVVGTAADRHILETTNLQSYFAGASKFNGNINNWDVSNVTNMNSLFDADFGSYAFNQRLDNWNVEKVTTMNRMFWFNPSFNNNSISNWRPISCSNFGDTFYGSVYNHPINWPFSASNITMEAMFRGNDRFNQNIGHWDVSRVTNMRQMFYENFGFRNSGSSDINNWRPISCSNFSSMFQTSVFNQPIGNWPISASGVNMTSMFRGSGFNQNIGAWDVSRVTNMGGMFQDNGGFNNSGSSDINNWRPISCSSFGSMFYNASAFNQPIGNWPISASNINMQYMFSTSPFNQNIGSWDVSKVTSMTYMFSFGSFNNSGSNTINNWRPISCSNFSNMFNGATAFNQPIGNWPLSASNINMSSMFLGATTFNQDIGSWDTSRVTNMTNMFQNAHRFNQPVGSWNTSAVTNMSGMFYMYQSSLFNQNINSWNVSNVTNMSEMFRGTTAFNQPIGSWDVSNVTNMSSMFIEAFGFNQDIGTWNVGKVTNFSDFMATKGTYSYLHTIYDGWINYRLQPQRTITFSTIKYSGSAAEGRGLLARTYNTASITGYSNDGGFLAITCSANHNVIVGNKVFISGSSYPAINGVQTVTVAGSPTTLTFNVVYDPTATGGTIITGYGWTITDGGPV